VADKKPQTIGTPQKTEGRKGANKPVPAIISQGKKKGAAKLAICCLVLTKTCEEKRRGKKKAPEIQNAPEAT